MVQGLILEVSQKVLFEINFVCYLHYCIVSFVLNKNKKMRRTFCQNHTHLILQLVNRDVCSQTP